MNEEKKFNLKKAAKAFAIGVATVAGGILLYFVGKNTGYADGYNALDDTIVKNTKSATLNDGRTLNANDYIKELAKTDYINTIEG